MTDETGADVSQEPEVEAVEAEVEQLDTEVTGNEAESPPADKEEVEEKPDPFQKRIDKLTRRFRASERDLQELRKQNQELQAQLEAKPAQTEALKTLQDFEYDEVKFREYLFGQAAEVARKEAAKVAGEHVSKTRAEASKQEFSKREDSYAKEVKDYHETVYEGEWAASDAMAEEIRHSDIGPELAYHLAKNPDVAEEIASLSSRETIRRMAQLETELKAEKSKPGKKVSTAPPPPPQVKGGDAGLKVSTTDPASDKLSDEEWFRAEEKRLANKRRT